MNSKAVHKVLIATHENTSKRGNKTLKLSLKQVLP